jgi:hypothetical protein
MLDTEATKKNRTINQYFVRDLTAGYSDMVNSPEDPMFEAYKRGYNSLYDDLQRTKAEENPDSYHVILNEAASNIFTLHQRSAANCAQIVEFTNHFLHRMNEAIEQVESDARDFLIFASETWKDALESTRLKEGIGLIRAQYLLLQMHHTEDLEIKIFGNIKTLVFGALDRIENMLIEAAEKNKVYQGMNNAHSFALTHGYLISFDDYMELDENRCSSIKWYGTSNKNIRELFNYGHKLKTACNIRFINLTDEEGMSSTDAHNLIHEELEELGVNPSKCLSGDGKNMTDRCNRYKKSRMKELKQITRNTSR